MGLLDWLWEQHQFLMQQCFLIPFAALFYYLAKWEYLSLTSRYLFVCVGGCVLAVVTMGIYSILLFSSTCVFILLVSAVDPSYIHAWTFAIQMLWQTFWHLLIQYREYYLHQPVCTRLFLAVSSLMLLTQRITSVSMDLQEKEVIQAFKASPDRKPSLSLLPLISYILSFTTLLGGPLCSYSQFVSQMEEIKHTFPPPPFSVVFLKSMQVLLLQCLRYCIVFYLRRHPYDQSNSTILHGVLWLWALALALRIQYYSHWKLSECLNNAAGFGYREGTAGDSVPDWSGLSDGDFWTIEASSRMSEFARRWNATTASWLRRLVYMRCKSFPLFLTFGFSVWWHGLHLGQFVGFMTWAATVKADYHIHRHLQPRQSFTWRKIYTCLSWINTQMMVTCVVIAVEMRNMSSLRLLFSTYAGLFPFFNVILLFVLLKANTVYFTV